MVGIAAYAMVYLGAALMVYNIYCFVKFARFVRGRDVQGEGNRILYVPITLLVLFLLGYLAVGLFGKPDLVVGGILFGGSIFVFVMYRLMNSITQRVIKNEQIEARLMAAEESNRVKTSFLASISHEMRTPMNVILGLDNLALKNPDLAPETRSQLEKIGVSGRHLLGLINNALDMNSIESGHLTVRNERFDLRETWAQVNAIADTLCDDKGLAYETSISKKAAGWYVGDEMLLKQAIFSIVENAVKYTDAPGTVTFSITAEPAQDGSSVIECSVSDTGIGMSPEFLSKVFEVFDKEDASSTTRHGGTGLGLAATKSKIDLLGGTIDVKSEKGVGSTFTIRVALTPCDCEANADEEAQGEQGAVSVEGCRILVADDVAENAEIVSDLLELEGAEAEVAENGQVALDMFRDSSEFHYDAVLMDLRMPVMDGLEAARAIRQLDRPDAASVPILALTANAFESDVQDSLDAGMNTHLVKPIDADKLYETLGRLIRQAPKRKLEVQQ